MKKLSARTQKEIMEALNLDRPKAKLIQTIRAKKWDNLPDTIKDLFPQTKALINSCYCTPADSYIKLNMFDEIIEGHGVEHARANRQGENFSYVNMGDPYICTIVLWHGAYRLTDWGSIVERHMTWYD